VLKLTPQHKKLGYYKVGNQEYFSKIDALISGSKQNISPTWSFNDSVWQSLDWKVEPETSLLELYKVRARQIREKYDYVVIYYSGGSDSQTVVEAFIDAKCHIDEIVTTWNKTYDKDFISSSNVTDARNNEAEFELTAKPGLEWIKSVSPNTKITYHDISVHIVDILDKFDGEEWVGQVTEHLNPQNLGRYSGIKFRDQRLLLDKGFRTAMVYGADKPKVCIKDDKYCVYFVDVITNNFKAVSINHDYDNMVPEYFFWSPDLPVIVVKQAHVIKKWFEFNSALKPVLAWPNHNWSHRNTYETILRPLIYPNWDYRRFQVNKPSSTIYCEIDNWFFKYFKDSRQYHTWQQGVNFVESNIDKKYLNYTFNKKFNGLVGMINGHFFLE